MIRLATFALVLALAACGAPAPQPSGIVVPPRFSDSDPGSFGAGPPSRFPVHGIDVARYQSEVDWERARASGVNFAFIKATEGGDDVDPTFTRNWQNAGAAGVRRGAYHFYYFCRDPESQARNFINTVPREPGALPPVVDLEWNPFSPTCTYRPPGEDIRRDVATFIDIVSRHYGQRIIIYTGIEFWRDRDIRELDAELWLRSVARPVEDAFPGTRPTFWQYSGTGIVDGIGGNTDLNAFMGTEADWRGWLSRRTR